MQRKDFYKYSSKCSDLPTAFTRKCLFWLSLSCSRNDENTERNFNERRETRKRSRDSSRQTDTLSVSIIVPICFSSASHRLRSLSLITFLFYFVDSMEIVSQIRFSSCHFYLVRLIIFLHAWTIAAKRVATVATRLDEIVSERLRVTT